jgi:hypothetical protein
MTKDGVGKTEKYTFHEKYFYYIFLKFYFQV